MSVEQLARWIDRVTLGARTKLLALIAAIRARDGRMCVALHTQVF